MLWETMSLCELQNRLWLDALGVKFFVRSTSILIVLFSDPRAKLIQAASNLLGPFTDKIYLVFGRYSERQI